MKDGERRLNANVDSTLYRAFQWRCRAEGRSMSDALRELVAAYVEDGTDAAGSRRQQEAAPAAGRG